MGNVHSWQQVADGGVLGPTILGVAGIIAWYKDRGRRS